MISTDFTRCPWCGYEQDDHDGIESFVCIECERTFVSICRIKVIPIRIAGTEEYFDHHERHYETRKIVSEEIV